MEYKLETEKITTIDNDYISDTTSLSHNNDYEIQRTRKTFIIILSILIFFHLIAAIILISGIANYLVISERGSLIIQTILASLAYGYGIFVAYRYSDLGLRIFGWFSLIGLIITCIGLAILLVFIIISLAGGKFIAHDDKFVMIMASVGSIIFIVPCFIVVSLSVIIVKYSFKLARLISTNKSLLIK